MADDPVPGGNGREAGPAGATRPPYEQATAFIEGGAGSMLSDMNFGTQRRTVVG